MFLPRVKLIEKINSVSLKDGLIDKRIDLNFNSLEETTISLDSDLSFELGRVCLIDRVDQLLLIVCLTEETSTLQMFLCLFLLLEDN